MYTERIKGEKPKQKTTKHHKTGQTKTQTTYRACAYSKSRLWRVANVVHTHAHTEPWNRGGGKLLQSFLTLRVYRARLSSKELRAIYTFLWARTDDTYLAWPWTYSLHQAYTRGSGKRMGPECVALTHQQVVDSALWYGIIQTPEPASAAGAEVKRRSPPWEVGNPSLQQQRQKLATAQGHSERQVSSSFTGGLYHTEFQSWISTNAPDNLQLLMWTSSA